MYMSYSINKLQADNELHDATKVICELPAICFFHFTFWDCKFLSLFIMFGNEDISRSLQFVYK